MSDRPVKWNLWSVAAAVLVIASLPAWRWGPRMVASMLVGGLWNVGSLWCLSNLLGAWLRPEPSRRQALGWLLAKCAWIGLLAVVVLRAPWLSFIGFGAGLTVVLMVVVLGLGLKANRLASQSHGR